MTAYSHTLRMCFINAIHTKQKYMDTPYPKLLWQYDFILSVLTDDSSTQYKKDDQFKFFLKRYNWCRNNLYHFSNKSFIDRDIENVTEYVHELPWQYNKKGNLSIYKIMLQCVEFIFGKKYQEEYYDKWSHVIACSTSTDIEKLLRLMFLVSVDGLHIEESTEKRLRIWNGLFKIYKYVQTLMKDANNESK